MAKEKPPVFGMLERGGQVVVHLLSNVKQKTIEPFIKDTIESGSLVYTDEYSIYARLETWGYDHKSVNHSRGEYARDEDGDGFCEVHVHTREGFWSLLCSWLRPHRGISQEKLRDCLKTGPEACWQVDTFSGHLTGAQSPQSNMITSV